jgi:hypothetical protein
MPSATSVTGPALTANAPAVRITYLAPTAEASATSMKCETQPQGTVSAPQALTVTNKGSAPLVDPPARTARTAATARRAPRARPAVTRS